MTNMLTCQSSVLSESPIPKSRSDTESAIVLSPCICWYRAATSRMSRGSWVAIGFLRRPQRFQLADSGADLVEALPVLLERVLPFQRELCVRHRSLAFERLLDLDEAGIGQLREVARQVAFRQAGDVEEEQEVRL